MGEIEYRAGLYMRLSKDDERGGESVSIENQRLLLSKYAGERGWEVAETYADDGVSGTSLNRPAFLRMLSDARDKRINMVLVKDLSRLGRNHIEVGRLTEEVFPSLGVRFIAVNDGVDSLLGEDDLTPYRNLFNEFLSRDTSRKVKTVKRACMERGMYLGVYAPLGYKKDPSGRRGLVADEETAYIIRRIFALRSGGRSFRAIAALLNGEGVPPPREIYRRREGRGGAAAGGQWSGATVSSILRNEAYIGNTVQGKYGTVSYKNRKILRKPKEQWVRVENTHEPLIAPGLWEAVQAVNERGYKPRRCADGIVSIFSGILKCARCGANMRAHIEKGKRADGSPYRYAGFVCANYAARGKSACSAHMVYERPLSELVLGDIRKEAVSPDKSRVTGGVIKARRNELAARRGELAARERRIEGLERALASLYEDKLRGIITESAFKTLFRRYEGERERAEAAAGILRGKLEEGERELRDGLRTEEAVRAYSELTALTRDILWSLVESIEISEAGDEGGRRVLGVRIIYRYGRGGTGVLESP